MTSQSTVEIPPRPSWMRPAGAGASASSDAGEPVTLPGTVLPREEPIPDEVRQRRILRGAGNAGTGVLVSAAIHLAILLALNVWLFVMRVGPSGYVINCQIQTEDDGAATEVPTLVQAPIPDEPPPAENVAVDVQPAGGVGEGELARIGVGGGGNGNGAGGGGVGFFGTKAKGNSFVFVVDRSSSMRQEGRLIAAKRELNRAIGTLQPHQRFYVLFYNNSMHRMLDSKGPDGLVFATPKLRDEVRAWLRPLQPKGGTQPAESLRTALEMRPDVIFFLTDGHVPDDTDNVVRSANVHGTIIHTTALVSQHGETLLQQIADDNGGTYRHIPAAARAAPDRRGLSNRRRHDSLVQQQRAAEAKLRAARKYLEDGRPRTGRRWLEHVMSEYPGSTQAQEAEKLLREL